MRRIRFAGHPLHPMLVHLPLALWAVSLPCDLFGLWSGEGEWWRLGFLSAAAGTVSAVPAGLAGLLDLMSIDGDDPAQPTAVRHMTAIAIAGTFYVLYLIVRRTPAPPESTGAIWAIVLSALGLLFLLAGGWLGGRLVYTFGVGRRKL